VISHFICSKNKLADQLIDLYKQHFSSHSIETGIIEQFIADIRDESFFLLEYPYVDKVYRDSYYTYFSSKKNNYPRDCIRVSIFSEKIELRDFYNNSKVSQLRENYRGYFVVRPTRPSIFGRTTIDKRSLKDNDFLICETKFSTTAHGLKFEVNGFPYSSQDSETISCAETSLWGVMEYFSHRYPKYATVLPSTIIETLKSISFKRQLPSSGLTAIDLSYSLKQFGFGTMVYARENYVDSFEGLLSCYVESGIPVIAAVSNKNNIHHAYICCGREEMKPEHFQIKDKSSTLHDFDMIKKSFIFIDDNHFPYQRAYLSKPCDYYNSPDWKRCEISHFIVPLYPKIYLDAYEAKKLSFFMVKQFSPKDIKILRVLLSSSRSYKNDIISNPDLSSEFKEKVICTPMPKFIWVCELTNNQLLKQKKCLGSIVLDATEPNTRNLKPLIYFQIGDRIFEIEKDSLICNRLRNHFGEYAVYQNNLNGF